MKWTTEDSSEVVIAVNYVHYAVVKSVRKWLISKLIASACFPQINLLISDMAGHLACSSGYNTNHEPKTFCRLIRRCCLLRHPASWFFVDTTVPGKSLRLAGQNIVYPGCLAKNKVFLFLSSRNTGMCKTTLIAIGSFMSASPFLTPFKKFL